MNSLGLYCRYGQKVFSCSVSIVSRLFSIPLIAQNLLRMGIGGRQLMHVKKKKKDPHFHAKTGPTFGYLFVRYALGRLVETCSLL